MDSKRRFRDVVQRIPLGYIRAGLDGRIEDVNDAWLQMHGYDSPDEVIGRPFSITDADADPAKPQRYKDRLLAGESIPSGDAARKRKDGSIAYHTFCAHPIVERGKVVGFEGFITDITERRRLEGIFQRGKRQWETTFDAVADWISLIDADGRIVRSNRAGERLFKIPVERIVGQKCCALIHGTGDALAECPLPRMLQTRKREHLELYSERLGRWLMITTDPVLDEAGGVTGAVHIVRDITERKLSQRALEERSAQLEALRRVGLDIVARLDPDTLLLSIVSQAAEILGGNTGGIYLHRPDKNALEWVVAVGPHSEPLGSMLGRGEGLAGKVWDTGQTLIVDDYRTWEGRAAKLDAFAFNGVIGAPMRYRDEFLGVLLVHKDAPDTFSQADAELLNLFAAQASVAIRNARLYEQSRESEDKFRTLADQSPEMIFINKRGRIVYANRMCEELMGYSREEFYSPEFNFMSLIAPEDAARVAESFRKHMQGQNLPAYLYSLVTKDGRRLEALLSSRLIPYEGEQAILGTVVDITERVRADHERERLLAQLQNAMTEVKLLSGILPICASCKRIRDENGDWHAVEEYVRDHSEADFSHSICPDCVRKLYPDL